MGYSDELYKRALSYNNAKQYDKAYPLFLKAAKAGHADSQNMVGRYLDEGWNVTRDHEAAAGWYWKAASQGHAQAQTNLGISLHEGSGVARDRSEAYRWFLRAAEQGHAYAQFVVGRYLEEGWAGWKDLPAAARWYRKAAEQGNAYGEDFMGHCLHLSIGVEENPPEAYRWYLRAAEQGIPNSQNMVGRYLNEGWGGVQKDVVAAAGWYRKSAEQGHAPAQANLGSCYWGGTGVKKDLQEAFRWYLRAAEQDHAYAQYMVGRAYEEGWAGTTDLSEAYRWYQKAAEQGSEDGKAALERIGQPPKGPSPASGTEPPAQTPPSGTEPPAQTPPSDPAQEVTQLLAELDALTGLAGVKREIHRRVASVQLSKLRGGAGKHGSLHMVFSGNPGTGKTTVARLVGKIYHALGLVRDGDLFVECSREDLVGSYIGHTAPKVMEQVEKALGGILFIDEAYSLYVPGSEKDFGGEAIDTLVKAMEDHRDDLVVIMAGYTKEMHDMIRHANPGLASRFRTWVEFEDYNANELAQIAKKMLGDRNLTIGEDVEPALRELIAQRCGNKGFGNARGVRNLLDDLMDVMDERLAKRLFRGEQLGNAELQRMEREDVEQLLVRDSEGVQQPESLDDLLAELDSLIGLESAKRAVRIRVAQAKFDARAKAAGVRVSTGASSLHMVFSGNPGTGKTTMARLVGRIYHALGIVHDANRFVECGREDLVGSYVGHTAPKVKQQVERALGGVLFIDEAYSLYRPDAKEDFGAEAIDALVALMEDHRDDLVVIMAGYTNEMRAMIEGSNPGLKSRFRTWVEFEDYTIDELARIFEAMAAGRGLRLEPGCREQVAQAIAARRALGGFGNARGVRNLLDDVVERQILRLVDEGDAADREGRALSREEFETIRAVDIPPVPRRAKPSHTDFRPGFY